jgi:hypothetical protein
MLRKLHFSRLVFIEPIGSQTLSVFKTAQQRPAQGAGRAGTLSQYPSRNHRLRTRWHRLSFETLLRVQNPGGERGC